MNVLGIDTATDQVGVALGDDRRVLGDLRVRRGRRHAELLVPAIRQLTHDVDVDLAQLAALGVGLGPGLFTGLRVGITTAKLLAEVLHLPVVGVPSLDLVAYPLRHSERQVAVVVDARRGEVFWALYRPVPGGVQRITEYSVAPPEDVAAELEAHREETLLAGDGVSAYRSHFDDLGHAEWAGPAFDAPSPSALVQLTAARVEREEFGRPADLQPLYVREADAEINWERRAS